MDEKIPIPDDESRSRKERRGNCCSKELRLTVMKIYGVICGISILFAIGFVIFCLAFAGDNNALKLAVGLNGYFASFLQIQKLDNKAIYGFIVGLVIFSYFCVILSMCFLCGFCIYFMKNCSNWFKRSLIVIISFVCCSGACLKSFGVKQSQRQSVIVWPDDSTNLLKSSSSLQSTGQLYNSYTDSGGFSSAAAETLTPTVFGAETVSEDDDDGTDEDKKYNPFDTESFKRKYKHATFHGFSNKKQTMGPAKSADDSAAAGGVFGTFKRMVGRKDPEPQPAPSLNGQSLHDMMLKSNSMSDINQTRHNPLFVHTTPQPFITVPQHRVSFSAVGPTSPMQPPRSVGVDVIPKELIENPHYQSLIDTASKHIRIMSQKNTPSGLDIPTLPHANNPIKPSRRERDPTRSDSEFDDEEEWDYDPTGGSPSSFSSASEKEFLTTAKIAEYGNDNAVQ